MSRPLVVSFLLLATIANAAVTTRYDCGYTTGCDECVENKASEPITKQLALCEAISETGKETYYRTLACNEDGKVEEVEYYDAECKIQKGIPSHTNDYSCQLVENSKSASVEVTKKADGKTFAMKYCENSGCSGTSGCITGDIESLSGGCSTLGSNSYKAKVLATGDSVLFISAYSGTGCKRESLLFQGEFTATTSGACNNLRQLTTYKCDAPSHYTGKSCGLVESCNACREGTKIPKSLEDICVNDSSLLDPLSRSSSKLTCSGGKVTKTLFTDDRCTEQNEATTTESCVYSTSAKYAKLSPATNSLHVCSSLSDCERSSGCESHKPSSPLDTSGKCVYDSEKRFSYKASKNGNNYRVAVFNDDRKCEKGLYIQGDFTPDKCVKVRTATKTECSGSFAMTTMLAASVIVAAMSLLLF